MKEIAIIVAGGSGTRFGGQVPKQFLSLCGEPVLMHTVRAFAGPHRRLVVVLPEAHIAWWQDLCRDHKFGLPHRVVAGGASRWESVRNGLTAVASEVETGDVIAVHDGVRPLASEALIAHAFATAHAAGSAIPVVPVTDTVRQLYPDGTSTTLDRATLRAVQTPQAFDAMALIEAYRTPYQPHFTDDASVMEHAAHTMTLIDGEVTNIKITHPADLRTAALIMEHV